LKGLDEEFNNIIEEAIPLWKNRTKYRFLYANPSRYMSFAILRMSISFQAAWIVVLTNLKKMYAPSLVHTIFKGYILGTKMVGASQG
jgi:hypothetical protein